VIKTILQVEKEKNLKINKYLMDGGFYSTMFEIYEKKGNYFLYNEHIYNKILTELNKC